MFDDFCGTVGGATIIMNQNMMYKIPITVSDTALCPGDIVELMIDTANLSNLNVTVMGSGSLSCNNCPNPLLTYNGGTVVVEVTADESLPQYCGAIGSKTFTLKPDSMVTLAPQLICPGVPRVIQLAGFLNPVYQILHGGGTVNCNNCGQAPEVTLNSPDTLQITSDNPDGSACQLVTKIPLNFATDDQVTLVTVPSADSIHQGEIVTVSISPANGSMYQWKVNGITITGSTASVNAPFDEKENLVMVQWINSNGCVQTLMQTISAQDPEYKIPNAFTPGNTMTNTHFRVRIEGNYDLVQLLVFNRWGQVVYDGNDDIGWDGRRGGEPAPPEVYTYIAKLRAPSGRILTDKGDVTLIR
jgi:gliding motility-associated-like protein